MKQRTIFDIMREREYEQRTLDDCYYNYDSELIIENMPYRELKRFLWKHANPSKDWAILYHADCEHPTLETDIRDVSRIIMSHVSKTRGYAIIKNQAGTLDVHKFWRKK